LVPFDGQILSNSILELKFDLEFEIRIRHFLSNSELFSFHFEIRPSLVNFHQQQ